MKKLRLVVGVALLLGLVMVGGPARADTQDFSISLFSADYYLGRDQGKVSELKVTEKIVAP